MRYESMNAITFTPAPTGLLPLIWYLSSIASALRAAIAKIPEVTIQVGSTDNAPSVQIYQ